MNEIDRILDLLGEELDRWDIPGDEEVLIGIADVIDRLIEVKSIIKRKV